MEKITKMSKKGNALIPVVIGALLVVVVLVALAPTMFQGFGTGATGLANASVSGSGMPSWFPTTGAVVVAVGLLFLLYRSLIKGRT